MQLNRAKQLAEEHGYAMKPFGSYDWSLSKMRGYGSEDMGTLSNTEINYLREEDFIEFYLQD